MSRQATRARPRGRDSLTETFALWCAFAATHAWLAFLALVARPESSYDLQLYRAWVAAGLGEGTWPVLDVPWVYPAGALLPMTAGAGVVGSAHGYALSWLAMVAALHAVALAMLLRAGRGASTRPLASTQPLTRTHGRPPRAGAAGMPDPAAPPGPAARVTAGAWWWVAATVALGPVAVARLDGVVAPLVVVALCTALTRPALASALLVFGGWVKVAPGVLLVALLAATRRPGRVLGAAAATTVVVVGGALLLGAGDRVLGFLQAQDSRGLQVESVAATPFSLARWFDPSIRAELDVGLNTFEIAGVDTSALVSALDVLLPAVVALVTWLVWRARRRGHPPVAVLLHGALALSLTLVVVNKVGSPQFVSWLLPPVAVALATFGLRPPWRGWAAGLLVVALLTQWVYPFAYGHFLVAAGPVVVGAAVRNALLVALLATGLAALTARPASRAPLLG